MRPLVLDLNSPFRGLPKTEILAGMTVAFALVPECVAFAFVAGVPPLVGLYSAFIICLITAICGGRPGMISGAAGAMAVVAVGLVMNHGIAYLFPAVVLCGLIQLLVGVLGLGKLIRLVPHPVMLGFVNGLALVILFAQMGSFKALGESGRMEFLQGSSLYLMAGMVALTMAIILVLPKFTRVIPSTLAAILIVSLTAFGINKSASSEDGAVVANPVITVKDMLASNMKAGAVVTAERAKAADVLTATGAALPAGVGAVVTDPASPVVALTPDEARAAAASIDAEEVGISGGLPRFAWLDYTLPPFSLATLWIILPFSLILAGVGLVESLMTMTLVDELTETRGSGNRECLGQGLANVVCGIFGGMGGCAMIGQSLINVKSGGRHRLSGVTASVVILMFILFLSPLIEAVPMAALVGVMFVVVIGTFEWTSLQMWRRVPISEFLVMLIVAGYTVIMHDLATAVILGVAVSALFFAWNKSKHLIADVSFNEHGSKIYQLHGALFFASVLRFRDLFDPANDPDDVVIDFYFTRVYDQSGLEAINGLAQRYAKAGKRLHLNNLSEDSRRLLERAGDLVDVNISEFPHYHVATDRTFTR